MIRSLARQWLDRCGYEIHRKESVATVGRAHRVCEVRGVPILQSLAFDDFQRACPPLLPDPMIVRVPTELKHYRSLDDALDNISVRQYFDVRRSDKEFTISDVYPGSHYYSRQRMLYTAYSKWFGLRLNGVSVLDVGCSSGYYSFFCSRLGAASVTGVDARPEHEAQFDLLHGTLNLPDSCRYRHLDMETELETLEGPYDLILAQGVLYHLYDHPRFLRNLFRLTRHVLVLEGECSGRPDNLCLGQMENTSNLRDSIHGPVIHPSLSWMIELVRWAGFRSVTYLALPAGVEDRWRFGDLYRAMLICLKK